MYTGAASRKNYFTVLGTINRENFSFHRDISTRSFFIELTRPESKSSQWEKNYAMFFGTNPRFEPDPKIVQQRKHKFLSSIYQRFQQKPTFDTEGIEANHIRHQSFFFDVLPLCCQSREQFLEVIAYAKERIATSDYDIEVINDLLAAIAEMARHYHPGIKTLGQNQFDKKGRFWITTDDVARIYSQITQKKIDQVTVTQRVKSFCERHHITDLVYAGSPPGNRKHDLGTKRGFWFDFPAWDQREYLRDQNTPNTENENP